MDLLYVNVIEGNQGWGAECFINQGFLRNGVRTHNIDFRRHRGHLIEKYEEVPNFDAMLLQRGDYFPIELIKAVNRPRFFWASELVSRCRDQDRLLSSNLFDHVFVHTQACLRAVVKNGWVKPERVSVMLNGFDPASHHPITGAKKDIDVLFYGAITPRRQKILDELGKKHSIYHVRWLGEEMTEVVNRSKILLNIHAEEFLDTETRIYEGLGWGAFILSEKLSEDNPFVPGQHFVEVQDVEEMSKAINHYLKNDAEREMIASQGHQEAMSKHTYDHRALEIIEVMKPYLRPRDSPAIDKEQLERYRRKESVLRVRYKVGNGLKSVLKR